MSKTKIFGILIFLIIALILWSSLNEKGIDGLQVKFSELDMVRNENNTGPVLRRYLVSVSDTIWTDLERYGNLMPYTKLGKTEVYYFLEGSPTPSQIRLNGAPFDDRFESYLVAIYQKGNMGQVRLKIY